MPVLASEKIALSCQRRLVSRALHRNSTCAVTLECSFLGVSKNIQSIGEAAARVGFNAGRQALGEKLLEVTRDRGPRTLYDKN